MAHGTREAAPSVWANSCQSTNDRRRSTVLIWKGEFTGKDAATVTVTDNAVVGPPFLPQHLDAHDVSWAGVLYGDRTRYDMWTIAKRITRNSTARDLPRVLEDRFGSDTEGAEERDRVTSLIGKDALMRNGIDRDRLSVFKLSDGPGRGAG